MSSSAPARHRRERETDRLTDADLLGRIAGGDAGALGPLFDRHVEAVRRVVRRLGVQPGEVDDVAQSTFLDVLDLARTYDGRPSAKPWIVGIAVVRVRRHRRSLARLAARLAAWAREPEPASMSPEAAVEMHDTAIVAERALSGLSQKKREVFVLAALEEIPGQEVASALGIPVATVWTRLHHARIELRAALAREDS